LSARKKLNVAFINGALVVAALIGIVFRSWTVFLIVAVVLVIGAIYGGDVRQGPKRR
jgi:ABC-type Co2+ transport system permease subunit